VVDYWSMQPPRGTQHNLLPHCVVPSTLTLSVGRSAEVLLLPPLPCSAGRCERMQTLLGRKIQLCTTRYVTLFTVSVDCHLHMVCQGPQRQLSPSRDQARTPRAHSLSHDCGHLHRIEARCVQLYHCCISHVHVQHAPFMCSTSFSAASVKRAPHLQPSRHCVGVSARALPSTG
jgi:hypothetical protein